MKHIIQEDDIYKWKYRWLYDNQNYQSSGHNEAWSSHYSYCNRIKLKDPYKFSSEKPLSFS